MGLTPDGVPERRLQQPRRSPVGATPGRVAAPAKTPGAGWGQPEKSAQQVPRGWKAQGAPQMPSESEAGAARKICHQRGARPEPPLSQMHH